MAAIDFKWGTDFGPCSRCGGPSVVKMTFSDPDPGDPPVSYACRPCFRAFGMIVLNGRDTTVTP